MQLSISGYRSAAKYWPEIFADVDPAKQSQILDALARLRPVLIQGYEAMVMVSCLPTGKTSVALHFAQGHQSTRVPQRPCLCAYILRALDLKAGSLQARLILEDPASEERMLQQWDHLLPQVLQRWNVNSGHLSAFSDGYRNACLLKDRVSAPLQRLLQEMKC